MLCNVVSSIDKIGDGNKILYQYVRDNFAREVRGLKEHREDI